MNHVIIEGRIARDLEIKYSQSNMAVLRFPLALDRGKDKDGNKKGADFPSCIAFGKTAESLNKFSGKGLRVIVIGHIQTGSYDSKDGKKVYTTDVIADRIEFIDFKGNGQQNGNQGLADIPEGFEEIDDDDIPF